MAQNVEVALLILLMVEAKHLNVQVAQTVQMELDHLVKPVHQEVRNHQPKLITTLKGLLPSF